MSTNAARPNNVLRLSDLNKGLNENSRAILQAATEQGLGHTGRAIPPHLARQKEPRFINGDIERIARKVMEHAQTGYVYGLNQSIQQLQRWLPDGLNATSIQPGSDAAQARSVVIMARQALANIKAYHAASGMTVSRFFGGGRALANVLPEYRANTKFRPYHIHEVGYKMNVIPARNANKPRS